MLSAELVEKALRLIEPLPSEEVAVRLRTTLLTRITNALQQLAEVVSTSNLLRKTVTVTATNGEAPLTTPLNATEPILLAGLRRGQVYISGFNYPAQYKADRSSLIAPASTEFAYWTLENQTILIRDATGLDNYDGDVIVRNVPYVPLLANVPVTLEPLLVEILARHAQPAEMAPAKS